MVSKGNPHRVQSDNVQSEGSVEMFDGPLEILIELMKTTGNQKEGKRFAPLLRLVMVN